MQTSELGIHAVAPGIAPNPTVEITQASTSTAQRICFRWLWIGHNQPSHEAPVFMALYRPVSISLASTFLNGKATSLKELWAAAAAGGSIIQFTSCRVFFKMSLIQLYGIPNQSFFFFLSV